MTDYSFHDKVIMMVNVYDSMHLGVIVLQWVAGPG